MLEDTYYQKRAREYICPALETGYSLRSDYFNKLWRRSQERHQPQGKVSCSRLWNLSCEDDGFLVFMLETLCSLAPAIEDWNIQFPEGAAT